MIDSDSENPFARMLRNLYAIANILIMVMFVLVTFMAFMFYWQKRKTATLKIERLCLTVNLVGCGMVVYALGSAILALAAAIIFDADLTRWWPSFSRVWLDWSHSEAVKIDWLISFFLGMAIWLSAYLFGGYDYEHGIYSIPDWYMHRKLVTEIKERHAQMKAQDPRRLSTFNNLPTVEQVAAVHRWENALAQLEKSIRNLNSVYS